jgi:hypothetical protein
MDVGHTGNVLMDSASDIVVPGAVPMLRGWAVWRVGRAKKSVRLVEESLSNVGNNYSIHNYQNVFFYIMNGDGAFGLRLI